MSTLGKVLAFLNVLVAIALLFIAGMDYAEWRAWHYATFRHQILLTGVPVDENEIDASQPDEPIVNKLTTNVLTDVFKGADGGQELGGQPVKTVMEEVERVRGKIKEKVQGTTGNEQKATIRKYLLLQARDVAERDQYKAIIDKPDVPAALGEIDKRFNTVKFLQNTKGNEQQVRNAAAELLTNLSSDPAWLERVRVVLGLDALAHGLNVNAYVMTQLAAGVKQAIIQDSGVFKSQYEEAVSNLQYESENLVTANKKLAELKKILADRTAEVALRQTEVNKNKDELAKLTAETNTEIAKLQAIQNDIFAIQQRLGKALDETYKLDEQLRQRAGQK